MICRDPVIKQPGLVIPVLFRGAEKTTAGKCFFEFVLQFFLLKSVGIGERWSPSHSMLNRTPMLSEIS